MNELDAIRARRAAITPGVWAIEHSRTILGVAEISVQTTQPPADVATFIAAAPADVDTLLAMVERLTGERDAERDAAKRHAAYIASCVDECGSYIP